MTHASPPADRRASAGYPAPTPAFRPSGRNAPADVGFVFAIVTVAFSLLVAVVSVTLPLQIALTGLSTAMIGALFAVLNLIELLLAATTAVFGIVGARRKGEPMLKAGIAIGVGAPGVVMGMVGLLSPLINAVAYNFA